VNALKQKLKDVEADVSRLRDERAELVRERDKTRDKFAKVPGYDTDSREFKAAEGAVERLREKDAEIGKAKDAQVGVLKMVGREPGARLSKSIERDVKAPGGWLAEAVRRKALGIDDVGSTTDLSTPFLDRLAETSALMRSGVPILDIETSSIKVPRLTGRLDPAPAVPELDPLPEADPPQDIVDIEPPKFGRLVTMSTEAYSDARPPVLAATERELIRAIASGFDKAVFQNGPAAPQPGLAESTGTPVPIPAGGPPQNLDVFATAIGTLRQLSAMPDAFYLSPATWEVLSKLKTDSTDSNVPLVAGQLPATDKPAESLLGIPVYLSEQVDEDVAYLAQTSELVLIRRQEAEVEVDPHYQFGSGGVGVRAIARLYLMVAQPEAVIQIEGLTTP